MKIIEKFLDYNPYSRPKKLKPSIKTITIHWTGKEGQSANNIWNWFNYHIQKYGKFSSSNDCIDTKGTIYKFIPENEISWHSISGKTDLQYIRKYRNEPNYVSHSIECIPINEKTGEFSEETKNALIYRCAMLCIRYDLNPLKDIYRHYDHVGKVCPKYYVHNETEWQELKKSIFLAYYGMLYLGLTFDKGDENES